MNTYIYCLSNSGLYLYSQGSGLLVDGLYGRGPFQCFSPFPETLRRQMVAGSGLFSHLDGVVFTHNHSDHCDSSLLGLLRSIRPSLPVFGYGMAENNICAVPVTNGVQRLTIGHFSITLLDTTHERSVRNVDKALFDLPNCILLIETSDTRILLTADAILSDYEAAVVNQFGSLNMVFSNPMQLATEEKRSFFFRIRMSRLLLTHLPAPEDDRYSYRILAIQECQSTAFGAVRPEITPQMAWLDGHAPNFEIGQTLSR